ncbi:MAG: hypothetical protein IPN94_24895 [Sphingobacteriales bacterium]|nr:hypothetical protein [Sphingobacteriales bacterium]
MTELHRRRIPLFFVSAIFRPNQVFFQPYGALFRQLLSKLTPFLYKPSICQFVAKHWHHQRRNSPRYSF